MMKVLEVSLTLVMILTIANLNLLLNNVTENICLKKYEEVKNKLDEEIKT
jgi:hypothetical protein